MNAKPYTYLIGWVDQNKWYYGVRSANKVAPEDDIWTKYFTSSKTVRNMRTELGEPDFILVDETFDTPQEARDAEIQFLQRALSRDRSIWLNKNIGGCKFFTGGSRGRVCSPETRKKIGDLARARKRAPLTPEHKEKIRQANLKRSPEVFIKIAEKNRGKIRSPEILEKFKKAKSFTSDETRKRMSAAAKGKIFSLETRKKLSVINFGKKQSDETITKRSLALKGKPWSEKRRAAQEKKDGR